ncbi:hypothetical protein DB346_11685 [Verrucomicrobia bacterium LW23]|nr:hypothetical protein DB346_11685 [Verrucomicrobia bacterium LW23]
MSVLAFMLMLTLHPVAAEDLTPIAQMQSPDTGETFVYGETKRRALYWSEDKELLSARITFSESKYSGSASNDETLLFTLPGVRYDKAKKEFYVILADNNQRVLFAQKKKGFMGKENILIARHVLLRVIKDKTKVSLAVDIYDPAKVAAASKVRVKNGTAEEEEKSNDWTLQSLIDK